MIDDYQACVDHFKRAIDKFTFLQETKTGPRIQYSQCINYFHQRIAYYQQKIIRLKNVRK